MYVYGRDWNFTFYAMEIYDSKRSLLNSKKNLKNS